MAIAGVQKLKYTILLGIVAMASIEVGAQNQYWITFTDKGFYSHPIHFESYVSPQVLARRQFFDIPLDETDLPLYPEYTAAITNAGGNLLKRSKWLNGMVVSSANPSFFDQVAQMEFVKEIVWLKSDKQIVRAKYNLQELAVAGEVNSSYGYSEVQMNMLNGAFLHDLGLKGQTIDIGVMDNGFRRVNTSSYFDHLNQQSKIIGVYNYVENTNNVFTDGDHGSYVMSTLAAFKPDTLIGTAPEGNYYLFTTEDNNNEGIAEEINWALAAEWADSALGIWTVLSTSLGYSTGFNDPNTNYSYADMDGNTTIITQAADLAARKGLLVVNSAGNEGDDAWKFITAPADGDSVLAVGAVDEAWEPAFFTSYGPSTDGRLKPNVSALGRRVVAAKYDETLQFINGTSFSCPIIAGLTACLWQAFPQSSNMEIIRAIEQSAHIYHNPDDQMGYGIPNFKLAFDILSLNDEIKENGGISLFPNPVSDLLTLTFVEESKEPYQVTISDMSGRVWLETETTSTSTVATIKVSDLPPGVYQVYLQQGKDKFRNKFIKR